MPGLDPNIFYLVGGALILFGVSYLFMTSNSGPISYLRSYIYTDEPDQSINISGLGDPDNSIITVDPASLSQGIGAPPKTPSILDTLQKQHDALPAPVPKVELDKSVLELDAIDITPKAVPKVLPEIDTTSLSASIPPSSAR